MVKKSPIALSPQEHREDAPSSWPDIQDSLAESSGVALFLVDGHQPPALVVSNNNSICRALIHEPETRRRPRDFDPWSDELDEAPEAFQ